MLLRARPPLLEPSDGYVGVVSSAGSDVGKAAYHVIKQQAARLIGQPQSFHKAWGNGTSIHAPQRPIGK